MQQLKTDVAAGRQFSVAMSLKNGTDYESKSANHCAQNS
jgi:hypothetical protein